MQDLNFIKEQIEWCKEKDIRLVILTHHAPTSLNTLKERNRSNKEVYNFRFTDLEYLIIRFDDDFEEIERRRLGIYEGTWLENKLNQAEIPLCPCFVC